MRTVRCLHSLIKKYLPVAMETAECAKRPVVGGDESTDSKVAKICDKKRHMRKVAIMLMYSGAGYHGMQRNHGFDTIEGALFDALLKADLIIREEHALPSKLQFQRASKTDKSVSALGQVVSMKLPLDSEACSVDNLNSRLPLQIRVLDMFRATKSFNCKARVNHRVYAYICPTFAFAPMGSPIDFDYRIGNEQLNLVRNCLERYRGTKNFYNFTSGRQPGDASCNRYIIDFCAEDPFVYENVQFVSLKVRGQSFMLHQIRKMIGLCIAIAKGYCDQSIFDSVFVYKRMDVPKAPGLGLMLDEINYDAYNAKYANQLGYSTIDWRRFDQQRQQFKADYIMPGILTGEVKEKSMLEWLKTLPMHTYDFLRNRGPNADLGSNTDDKQELPAGTSSDCVQHIGTSNESVQQVQQAGTSSDSVQQTGTSSDSVQQTGTSSGSVQQTGTSSDSVQQTGTSSSSVQQAGNEESVSES